MFAKKEIIGVDLGFHSVKVVRASASRGGSRIEGFHAKPTGLIPGAESSVLSAVWSQLLAEIIKENGIKARSVAVSIPGRWVFVKQLRVPAVQGERLERIVNYEAKQLIPFPLEQLLKDYHVFPSTPAEHEVTLIAIKREIVDDRVAILEQANLRPEIIDVGPLCLFNAFHGLQTEEDEVVAIVDIGASTTDIVIQQGRILKFPRSAPIGGNALTAAVAKAMAVDFEEAEQMKIHSGSVSPDAGEGSELEDVLTTTLDKRIATEIRRSFDFFIAQPDGMAVNRVLLCGGGARLKGIEEFLEDRLGVPVERANAVDSCGMAKAAAMPEGAGDVAGIALGLALRQDLPEGCIGLNFIPPRIVQQKERRKRRPALAVAAVLLAALVAASAYMVRLQVEKTQQSNEEIVELLRMGERFPEWTAVRQLEIDLQKRAVALEVIGRHKGRVSEVYREVIAAKPEGISIDTILVSAGAARMTIRGKAVDQNSLYDAVRQLLRLPYFDPERVQLRDTQRGVDGYYRFEIQANGIVVAPAPESKQLYEITKHIPDVAQARWGSEENGESRAVLTIYSNKSQDLSSYEGLLSQAFSAILDSGLKPRRFAMVIIDPLSSTAIVRRAWTYQTTVEYHQGILLFDQFLKQTAPPIVRAPQGPPGAGGVPGGAPGARPGAAGAAGAGTDAGAAGAAAVGR